MTLRSTENDVSIHISENDLGEGPYKEIFITRGGEQLELEELVKAAQTVLPLLLVPDSKGEITFSSLLSQVPESYEVVQEDK